jgi:hypothetical protein
MRARWVTQALSIVVAMQGAIALAGAPAGASAGAAALAGGGGGADEFALKAAFLFNFTRFVEWPPSAFADAGTPFRICVFGVDPFGARIDALAQRRVGERAIEVMRPTAPGDLGRCQIAYLGDGTAAAIEAAALRRAAPATLTVASRSGFARRGGMVALVTVSGRVRLHVNLASIRESPLRFSAKLLEVAEVRHGGGSGGR